MARESRADPDDLSVTRYRITLNAPVSFDIELLPGAAIKSHLRLIGGDMADGKINVDTQNERIEVAFTDDHGNQTSHPDGAVASYTTSDSTIATVTADANDPFQGDIAPAGAPGTVTLGVLYNGTALAPDGTPIPDPEPVVLEVDPGAPVGSRLSLVSQ